MNKKSNFEKNNPLTFTLLKKVKLISAYSTLIFYLVLLIGIGLLVIEVFTECLIVKNFKELVLTIIAIKCITIFMAFLVILIQGSLADIKATKK